MVQQEPGQGCKYHCFTGKIISVCGAPGLIGALQFSRCAQWYVRYFQKVNILILLPKVLVVPGRARDTQLVGIMGMKGNKTAENLLGYLEKFVFCFFFLTILSPTLSPPSMIYIVFNSGSTWSPWRFWHLIYIFCKTSSSNTKGRHKQARHKFRRWKGSVICPRSNANAHISRVQRLLFLHTEPEELISLLLLQFHYRKCWLQGRRAAAKYCCLSGPT